MLQQHTPMAACRIFSATSNLRRSLVAALVIGLTGTLAVPAAEASGSKASRSWRDANAAVTSAGRSFSGIASYYGSESGSRTASGARYDPTGLTAAHRSLPFGTKVRVTEPRSGRSVVVTINDRGPFIKGRVIDLSVAAARAIGISDRGVGHVVAEVL